jgi:amidophosphoribosyltransferase
MCGIVGVSGVDDAARLAFLGLYALQHRGQESAGIGRRCHRDGPGSASARDWWRRLRRPGAGFAPGRVALGHTRYSTAGGAGLVNAQPIVVSYREGDLGLVHNGNITNALTLREELVEEGALFQGTIDSEVIVHLISRSRSPTIGGADLRGAIPAQGRLQRADHRGRHPLRRPRPVGLPSPDPRKAPGRRLDRSQRELRPGPGGRALRARHRARRDAPDPERGAQVPQERLQGPPTAPCIFELVYFARPDSTIWGQSVDRARRAFGRRLAQEHPADADVVFSVPDSSNSAALGFAEESGIPYELGLIRNHYVGRTFIHPTQAGRDFRVRIKYNAVREVLEPASAWWWWTTPWSAVPPAWDSSASSGRPARRRSTSASPARPSASPASTASTCPRRRSSSARRKTVEEIRQHLDVDSLGYLSLEGMIGAVDDGDFCHACFSGEYDAPLVDHRTRLLAPSTC